MEVFGLGYFRFLRRLYWPAKAFAVFLLLPTFSFSVYGQVSDELRQLVQRGVDSEAVDSIPRDVTTQLLNFNKFSAGERMSLFREMLAKETYGTSSVTEVIMDMVLGLDSNSTVIKVQKHMESDPYFRLSVADQYHYHNPKLGALATSSYFRIYRELQAFSLRYLQHPLWVASAQDQENVILDT